MDVDDVTFYPDESIFQTFDRKPTSRLNSIDFLTYFESGKQNLRRAVACSCFSGRRWSITARRMSPSAALMADPPTPIPSVDEPVRAFAEVLEKWPADAPTEDDEARRNREQNATHVRQIWGLASSGHRDLRRHGIIVVAGATGSRKTSYAREIARQYIARLLSLGGERPHIVSYEDPIESWFANSPEQASASGFDYTPRHKGVDVRTLDDAVSDALRQKPALFYVNEVRDATDWRSLLYFAGTGHLAITTTHAGSLVEAFDRILGAADVRTPSERGRTGSRIIALLHLRAFGKDVIPSLWVQTAPALMALVQDGLSSILPSDGPTFGRAFFAEKLEMPRDLIATALQSDLGGE